MLFRKKLISMPHFSYGGPIFNKEYSSFLQKYIKGLKFNYEVRSFLKLSEFYSDDKISLILKLKPDVDEHFSTLKSKRRSQINSSYRNNPEIKFGKEELLNDFYKVYSVHMRELGSPSLPFSFFRNLVSNYEFGEATIVVVYFEREPASAGFKLSYMGFEEVCWASTLNKFNRYSFNMTLYWEMIKNSIINHNRYFSFGRSSKSSSSIRFKKQWDPDERQIYFNYSGNRKGSILDLKKYTAPVIKHIPRSIMRVSSKIIFRNIY